jgi:hypothetical protein
MSIGAIATLVLALALAAPARSEVKSVTPSGFEVPTVTTIAAPAERVDAAFGEVARWWSPSHTFSKDAANLSLELRAGSCFCERLKDGGSVPGEGLRLRGALGPLQTQGVDGTLSWSLKPVEGGIGVNQSYVVGGYIRGGMKQWAARVDRVLDEQLRQLKTFVESKSSTQ